MISSTATASGKTEKIKLFLALSRTPHGLLDLATPALAALLWLGSFPPLAVALLGFLTAFAGYTAVYALNDVVDFRKDRKKIQEGGIPDAGDYLDAAMVRHPMAKGFLRFGEGVGWMVGWAVVALIGAYLLNPVCMYIFLAGCALECIYCLLLNVTHMRTLVSGLVKTSGGLAAVFAVDPHPSVLYLIMVFAWLFFWEIGGQNIPADWHDLELDKQVEAKSIPSRFGLERAGLIVFTTLMISFVLSGPLLLFSPAKLSPPLVGLGLAGGVYLLLLPAYNLYQTRSRSQASALFGKASYYPLTMFIIVMIHILSK